MLIDVIFLDIDGVLNPGKDKYPHVFAPDCVAQLRRILDASPQAHVVFSTSWRTGFSFFALGWLWHQHDLPLKRVIARTPDIRNDRRGEEIQKWLADAPALCKDHPVRRYAALDDEPEPILEVIPGQNVFTCDPWHGLTAEVADRVIRHFAAPEPAAKQRPVSTTESILGRKFGTTEPRRVIMKDGTILSGAEADFLKPEPISWPTRTGARSWPKKKKPKKV